MDDLCLAWEWQYDADFVAILDAALREQGLSLLQVTPDCVETITADLQEGRLQIRAFWDRASDVNARFIPLLDWVSKQPVYRINRDKFARRSWDKAATHQTLTASGLHTPPTYILPSVVEEPDLAPVDLAALGPVFSIKPAHGGGGRGVVKEATTWQQVLDARQQYPADQYLLQAHVYPAQLDNRPAWFRILYGCGDIYPCWWDTCTHVYCHISPEEMERYQLHPLVQMAESIARISHLDVFSTEIAHTADGSFVIIDYINDPIDLRLQSQAFEGVPDWIVKQIAARVAAQIAATKVERVPA